MQEALRTLGLGLEVQKVRRVEIQATPRGFELDAQGEYGHHHYDWSDIESQSRAQQKHRRSQQGPAPWMDPVALTRWSVLLRVVGQLLDAQEIHDYEIHATVATPAAPQDFALDVQVNGRSILDEEQVQFQLLQLRTCYVDHRAVAPRPSARRPWWATWWKD
jgi:hypothetical protein